MAENSKISWCDHTINFWIGCTKVSPGCKFCYAEVDTFARRERSHFRELWGPQAERHRTSAALWNNPYKWNKNHEWLECEDCGWRGHVKKMNFSAGAFRCPNCESVITHPTRQRVFCQSLSDICEAHPMITDDMRKEIVKIVLDCSNLDFLFLTKRIENFNFLWLELFGGKLPDNLWVGTSVENQEYADKRIPELLKVPAKIRFLSCEPLLGPVDILEAVKKRDLSSKPLVKPDGYSDGIDWVIVGGESGKNARPMHVDWARSLRDQCENSVGQAAFHLKQWGEWFPAFANAGSPGGSLQYTFTFPDGQVMWKVGKKNSGRLLDGKEYSEFPK